MKQTVWREIHALRAMAAARGYDLPHVPLDPSTGITLTNGAQILGFTVDDPDAFSGISAPEVLYLVDEASGVADDVYEAIKGNLAGGGKLVETGNPTQTSGHFFDDFHDKRHLYQDGALIHISSLESPNVIADRIIVPGLATAEWVAEMRDDYGGPGEPVFDVRVGGDFPAAGPNTVIPLHLLEAAILRHKDGEQATGPLRLGVDVARFGDDDTVIASTRGRSGGVRQRIHGAPTTQVAGAVVKQVRDLRRGLEEVKVAIDEGSMGAGVVDQVVEQFSDDPGITVYGVNAAQSADDEERFDRKRDELWWSVREWLADAILEPCAELERELVAPTYALTSAGRIKVESKDTLKKRIKRSPDHADALALAVVPVSAHQITSDTLPSLDHASRWEGFEGRGFG